MPKTTTEPSEILDTAILPIHAPRQGDVLTPEQYRLEVVRTMPERELLALVRRAAKENSWECYHTYRSDRSEPGFPDLVLSAPNGGPLWFAELKAERGRTTPAQDRWLGLLNLRSATRAVVWRPSDIPAILALLRGEDRP